MARATKPADALTNPIDDATVYVSIQTFASSDDPQHPVVGRGHQFRGSHRVVQAHPMKFVPATLPQHEWPNPEL